MSEKIIYIARPWLNNNKEAKEFNSKIDAVKYLNGFLTDEMPVLAFEDYALIGKIFAKDGTDIVPKPGKPGRPKKAK